MASKAQLSPQWWKKSCPASLEKSAVERALVDFAKVRKTIERSGDAKGYFKAVGTLKSAIAKDHQTARKAKDKAAQTLLKDLEKTVHQETRSIEDHLTLKTDFSHKGLSAKSGVRSVPSGSSSSSRPTATIVNRGDRAWRIITANRSVSSAKSKSCEAIPKSLAASDLSSWKSERVAWQMVVNNQSGAGVVQLDFQLQYQWNGQSDRIPGLFLTDCRLWGKADVPWGYTLDVDLQVNGQPFNSGSRDSPVGAVRLVLMTRVATPLRSVSDQLQVICHGNGKREIKPA